MKKQSRDLSDGVLLRLEGIEAGYRERPVLRDLSLEVREGEIVGVVGPNGSGKSTLLKTVSGVLTQQAGELSILGMVAAGLRPREWACLVAVVSQAPVLPPSFSALDIVLMGRTPHLGLLQWEGRRDLEVAQEAMELTQTWELAARSVGELSGGERQRLLIARALAQETPLLLLDEPTASLDLAYQTGIMDLLVSLQEERGGALLMALHDLTLAARYCGRLVMLQGGSVFVEGTPEEVLTQENIAAVYGTPVSLLPHPVYGTPGGPAPLPRGVRACHAGWPKREGRL